MIKISRHSTICIWLAFLYAVCITLVIFSLTTYQLQHKIFGSQKRPSTPNTAFLFHECLPLNADQAKVQEGILQQNLCVPLTKSKSFLTPSDIGKYLTYVKSVKEDIQKSEQELKDLQNNPPSSKARIKELTTYLEELRIAEEIFYQQQTHLESITADIVYHEKIFGMPGEGNLWSIPEDILVVILIFSMGTLGSLIFLTMEFLKQESGKVEKFSTYFFRPLLGMVMALAVFVMFKSGQYSMGIESEEHLSPFFISFMSIVSGMLAEKAYGNLQLAGNKMLSIENQEKTET